MYDRISIPDSHIEAHKKALSILPSQKALFKPFQVSPTENYWQQAISRVPTRKYNTCHLIGVEGTFLLKFSFCVNLGQTSTLETVPSDRSQFQSWEAGRTLKEKFQFSSAIAFSYTLLWALWGHKQRIFLGWALPWPNGQDQGQVWQIQEGRVRKVAAPLIPGRPCCLPSPLRPVLLW